MEVGEGEEGVTCEKDEVSNNIATIYAEAGGGEGGGEEGGEGEDKVGGGGGGAVIRQGGGAGKYLFEKG